MINVRTKLLVLVYSAIFGFSFNIAVAQTLTNVAPLSTATSNSEAVIHQQTADKAIDQVIDGFPGDPTKEWATEEPALGGAGAVGAWLKLTWGSSFSVSKVVLYDRQSPIEQITAGRLVLSDGTTINTGTLVDVGPTTFEFSPKIITHVTFIVDAIREDSVDVGLMEMQVFATLLPDLTASAPTPASATAGTAQTYTATIANQGSVGTGATFPYFFQTCTVGGGCASPTDHPSSTMGSLAASGSGTATSPSITFPSPGTYSIRVCADKTSSAGGGVITELDEGNNCSSWTNVVVAAPPTPDLVASAPAPSATPVTVGVAVDFSGTVTNQGGTSTGGSFNNFFQLSTSAGGSNPLFTAISANLTPALGAGGITVVTSSAFTFASGQCAAGVCSVRLCADNNMSMSGTITESNEGNNCSFPWTNVTVTEPDLTASAPTPAIVAVGVSQIYTADISNIGNAGTVVSFPYFFQTATSGGGGGTITDRTSSSMGPLAASGSGIATSPSITFPLAGISSIRVCADKTNSSSTPPGSVTESNEGNNCSPWRDVTVTSALPPITATLDATPFLILPGASSLLTWSSSGADSCVSQSTPPFFSGSALSGTASVGPTVTTTYKIKCVGAGGEVIASDTVFVTTGKKPIFTED